MHDAIHFKQLREIRACARHGAPLLGHIYDLGHLGERGTALDLSMYYHRPDVALELLRIADTRYQGAQLARQSEHALAWAARDGRLELLEALLSRQSLSVGPGLGAPRWQGRSALQAAALRGHGRCAAALLRCRAWDYEPAQAEVRKWAVHWGLEEAFREADPRVI